jgi:hypothetical protein
MASLAWEAWQARAAYPAPTGISQADCLWARNGNTPCTSSPAQQPTRYRLTPGQIQEMWGKKNRGVTLYDYRCIVEDVEMRHNIKENS